jgi:hypothetical protein
MNLKHTLAKGMSQPMDRREFLARSGAAVLAGLGAAAVLKSLDHRPAASPSRTATRGYGASTYGGR